MTSAQSCLKAEEKPGRTSSGGQMLPAVYSGKPGYLSASSARTAASSKDGLQLT